VPARFLEDGRTGDALRAEHGFSCLVTATASGRKVRVLFDAGRTPDGLVNNMPRLEISPREIDVIVLSHGHWDHTTGMDGLVGELGRTNLPVLIHPEFWSRRRLALPGRDPVELPTTSRHALEGAGFEIVEERRPSFLFDGSLLVTRRGRPAPPSSSRASPSTRPIARRGDSPTRAFSTSRPLSRPCAAGASSSSPAAATRAS
jgi:7,8-dihydropterin-6-yl-methyl-4-(beta-D-ribofuranosyl)aminobenzene 5'-phosphate synthase